MVAVALEGVEGVMVAAGVALFTALAWWFLKQLWSVPWEDDAAVANPETVKELRKVVEAMIAVVSEERRDYQHPRETQRQEMLKVALGSLTRDLDFMDRVVRKLKQPEEEKQS